MAEARGAVRRPSRNLVLVAAAQAVSAYGTYLNMLALGLFALHITGSALQTGLFMALRLATGFIMGPIAGILATRYPRKPLMIGCDLLSAGTLALLVAAPAQFRPELLYALAVVVGAGQTQWGVALRSSLPDLVGADQRARANSQLVTARSIATLLGFASAGVLIARWGYDVAFLLDAGSYALSALLLTTVPIDTGRRLVPRGRAAAAADPARAAATADPTRPGRLAALRSGGVVRTLAPVLVGMIAVRTADAFGSASHNVGLPVYANQVRPDDPAAFAAIFTTAWAVGSLLAGRWCAHRAKRGGLDRPEASFGAATVLMSVFFVLAFTGPPLWLLIPIAVAAGAADGYAEIAYTTRLQAVEEGRRAHVFGFTSAAQNAGFGLGMIGCAALLEHFAPLAVVAGAHSVALAAAVVFLIVQVRARAVRRRDPAAEPAEVTV